MAGSLRSLKYAIARCSSASFETAYVQRASPTTPITGLSVSLERNACEPKTSLVEKQTTRSQCESRDAASSTFAEPTMLTRIVETGLLMTVSMPAIAAQCTTMFASPIAAVSCA